MISIPIKIKDEEVRTNTVLFCFGETPSSTQ